MTFSHVSVRASNIDRSIAFYRDFFGMELTQRRPIPQNKAEIAFLKDPGADFSLELTHYDVQKKFEQASYPDRTFDHLAFRVKDLRAMVERIRSKGFVISDEPFELSPGKWLAFVEDPDGTLIELIQS
jgi:lactoylglutathione lyase